MLTLAWRVCRGLMLFLGVALLVVVLWKLPVWQVQQFGKITGVERSKWENEYRKTLAQIIGGLVILFGVYLTYRRVTAAEARRAAIWAGRSRFRSS